MKLSLQQSLNRWIMLCTLLFAVLAGGLSGGAAFYEARELQDIHLSQIGSLLVSGKVRPSLVDITLELGRQKDEMLLVRQLGGDGDPYLSVVNTLPDGLHTLYWQGSHWRTLLISVPSQPGQPMVRFAVAQLTEVRNELALESSLRSLVPILLLAPVLLLLVHGVIRYKLRPLRELAERVDAKTDSDLTPLEAQQIPLELSPFINSINRLLARVQQSMNQHRRFVADAAHELRTPLTALSLMTENLARATDMTAVQERLQALQVSQQRMQALVSQLLGLARLQGRLHTEFQSVSLLACVQQVTADLYPLAEARRIDLGMLRRENLSVADSEGGLALLVRNALENAIRYTPEGGRVDIELYREGQEAVLSICDTGPGIPEQELAQVFEPFHRVGATVEPGSGLGLAISREIAHRLGGQISLQNQPQGGLCFCYRQAVL